MAAAHPMALRRRPAAPAITTPTTARRRLPAAAAAPAEIGVAASSSITIAAPPAAAAAAAAACAVVAIADVPPHLRFNRHVLHGYRRHPMTAWEALRSVASWHNETLNILTHLLGGGVVAYWLAELLLGGRGYHVTPHGVEFDPVAHGTPGPSPLIGVVAVADATALLVFAASARYHTFMAASASEADYRALLHVDLGGVVLVNAGATLSLVWLLLPCLPLWCILSLSLCPALVTAAVCALATSAAGRAVGFFAQFAARVGIILVSAATEAGHWPSAWLRAHLLVEAAPALGSVLNVLRLPEAWAPGSPALTYVAQSHVIMHVLVAGGMLANHAIGLHRAGHVAATPALLECAHANAAAVAEGLRWPWVVGAWVVARWQGGVGG